MPSSPLALYFRGSRQSLVAKTGEARLNSVECSSLLRGAFRDRRIAPPPEGFGGLFGGIRGNVEIRQIWGRRNRKSLPRFSRWEDGQFIPLQTGPFKRSRQQCRSCLAGCVGTHLTRLRDQSGRYLPDTGFSRERFLRSTRKRRGGPVFLVRSVGKPPLENRRLGTSDRIRT